MKPSRPRQQSAVRESFRKPDFARVASAPTIVPFWRIPTPANQDTCGAENGTIGESGRFLKWEVEPLRCHRLTPELWDYPGSETLHRSTQILLRQTAEIHVYPEMGHTVLLLHE